MLKTGWIGQINDGMLLEHWISIGNSIQDLEIGLVLCSTSSEMARPAVFKALILHDMQHTWVHGEYEPVFTHDKHKSVLFRLY